MNPFHYEAPFFGNAQFSINTALQILLPLNFKIVDQTENSLTVEGPGYNSTRENALLGMSHGELCFSSASISLKAELGGVDRLSRFLMIVLMGMGAINALIFIVLWFFVERLHAQPWFLTIPTFVFLPWVFIAPIMVKWIRKLCEEALVRFVNQIAVIRVSKNL